VQACIRAVQSFQLWAPYNEGYLAAEVGAQIHDLKLKPAADATVETKKFGSLKFTKKLELYAGPLQTFDAKNIDTFNF
jgi:rhamnose transport system substrate-binding protein